MGFGSWKPYVPVAKRRQQAARQLAKMLKQGQTAAPVVIEGRAIAKSFWGKAWCDNLERYSDYANRLPRGRTYVRNGSVLDLRIAEGEVTAMVSGSELYTIRITIAPLAEPRWTAICEDCSGGIDSLVELLRGRLAEGVMDRVCRQGDGLFPAPGEIRLSCSCPDWADMCKHVAAVLYGVGARLDHSPELLFVLRGVDAKDLIATAGAVPLSQGRMAATNRVLVDDDIAALFGLDMAETETEPAIVETAPTASAEPPEAAPSGPSKPGKASPPRRRASPRSPAGRGKTRSRKTKPTS